MTLQDIETQVLLLAQYDRYSSLSVDLNAEKVEDFSILHQCVRIARQLIVDNCFIPSTFQYATAIAVGIGTVSYTIVNTDFGVPVAVRFTPAGGSQIDMREANSNNILSLIGDLANTGSPSIYRIFGSTAAGLVNIEFYPISDVTGSVTIEYKPVLANITTATLQDVTMRKYGDTVVKLATAYAFYFFKKDQNNFDKWFMLGASDFKMINLKEAGSNPTTSISTEKLLTTKRSERFTI